MLMQTLTFKVGDNVTSLKCGLRGQLIVETSLIINNVYMHDGRKEFILVIFAATSMIIPVETLFDCSALASDLHCRVILLQEILAFIFHSIRPTNLQSLDVHIKHGKDPFPP